MEMKKTSVYLSDEDRDRLARLAERKGKSQAWVLREALSAYEAQEPDRNFEILDMRPIGLPDFEDLQELHDWVENTVGEAAMSEVAKQLDASRKRLS